MDAHTHRQPQRRLSLGSRRERPRRGREGDEDGVALGIHFDAAMPAERIAKHPPVFGQHVGIALRTNLLQQSRRALYVGEKECHRAVGEIVHT